MEGTAIYTFILIRNDGTYIGWSKAPKEKEAGTGMKWVEWGKELPEDIDNEGVVYVLKKGELIKG